MLHCVHLLFTNFVCLSFGFGQVVYSGFIKASCCSQKSTCTFTAVGQDACKLSLKQHVWVAVWMLPHRENINSLASSHDVSHCCLMSKLKVSLYSGWLNQTERVFSVFCLLKHNFIRRAALLGNCFKYKLWQNWWLHFCLVCAVFPPRLPKYLWFVTVFYYFICLEMMSYFVKHNSGVFL